MIFDRLIATMKSCFPADLLRASYVLPRLLNDIAWPKEPAHVCRGVVVLGERYQFAVDGVW